MTERRLLKEETYVNEEIWEMTAPRAVRYEILTSHLFQDGVDYLTYGIRCMGDREGTWVQMDAVADISFQRESVAELADLFNRRQLSHFHFRDAVLDRVNA